MNREKITVIPVLQSSLSYGFPKDPRELMAALSFNLVIFASL